MSLTYELLVADKKTPGSIANWANRNDLPVTLIVSEAEAHIYSMLRAQEMITRASISLPTETGSIAAPNDFISALAIMWNNDTRPIDLMDAVSFQERCWRDSDGNLPEGIPRVFAAIPNDTGGGTYYFDTKSDQAYSGYQWYYKRPAALSDSNQTNFLTFRYPSLLRRACTMYAYEHQQDFERAALTETSVNDKIFKANVEADLALSGAIFDSEVR